MALGHSTFVLIEVEISWIIGITGRGVDAVTLSAAYATETVIAPVNFFRRTSKILVYLPTKFDDNATIKVVITANINIALCFLIKMSAIETAMTNDIAEILERV